MSNVKRKENEGKLEKLLQQNPHGIKISEAAKKLGVDRSTVYKYLYSLDLQGRTYYERGIAYPGKPKKEPSISEGKKLDFFKRGFGFFDWLERRAERKRLEKEREILELKVEAHALREEILMDEDKYNSEAPEERVKRRQKYRELLKPC